MKNYILSKLFNKSTIQAYLKSATSKDEQLKAAMSHVLAEGMTHRVLPEEYEDFIGHLMTGVKTDKEVVALNMRRRVLDSITHDVSQWHAIYAMAAPYVSKDGQWPEQKVYGVRQRVKSELLEAKNVLVYVKILSTALMETLPTMPENVAKAIASSVYYTVKMQKEKTQ